MCYYVNDFGHIHSWLELLIIDQGVSTYSWLELLIIECSVSTYVYPFLNLEHLFILNIFQ